MARLETAQKVYHATCHSRTDPDIAIYDPYDVTFCLAVAPTHVPDLGVRSQVMSLAIATGEIRILFFH
jgi:hypothetical protein